MSVPEGIPEELRARRQWVVWKYEETPEGRSTKMPYQAADLHRKASSTEPRTWASFDDARRVREVAGPAVNGIGYVLSPDDGLTGFDLDDCLEGDEPHPAAQAILDRLRAYTEVTPSGRGLHVFVRAVLPPKPNGRTGRRRAMPWGDKLEVYDRERFLTVTGRCLNGRLPIADRQAEVEALVAELFPSPEAEAAPADGGGFPGTDGELLDRAFAADNGRKVRALYDGGIEGYASRSEADLALCSALAFWTGPDPDRVDRLFRGSGLVRPKWERQDYREATIGKALARRDFYAEKVTRASESPESPSAARGDGDVADSGDSVYRSHRVSQVTPKSPVGDSDPVESPESAPLPFALPVDEFVAEEDDAPEALIGGDDENLLPAAGLLMTGGRGGKGKTTLTIEAALHMASGVEWLGFSVDRPLRVLLIENEGPKAPFRSKLQKKLEGWEHDLAGGLYVHTLDWGGFTLADPDALRALRDFIEQHKIDVVIGDPLDSLGLEGVGSPADVRDFMGLLHRVGLHRDTAWWLLHHPHKGESADPLDELSGAWGGKPDTVLLLEKLGGNRARLSFPKLRWSRRGQRSAYLLAFDPDAESFTVVHEEPEEERDYDAEIAALLVDGSWRTPKEIAASADRGGIGANVDLVKDRLGKRPDLFSSRTGDEAKALGRHPTATVWQLTGEEAGPGQDELDWS